LFPDQCPKNLCFLLKTTNTTQHNKIKPKPNKKIKNMARIMAQVGEY
jgi:hypothetical protein